MRRAQRPRSVTRLTCIFLGLLFATPADARGQNATPSRDTQKVADARYATPSRDTSALTHAKQRNLGLWEPGKPAPVLFSFSGGISLGAYQAGVNWAMLEMIKQSKLFPDDQWPATLPRLSVAAMTGASAGNINVMLAAVEYCDLRLDRPADSTLFWQMWVGSGWNDLFPADPRDRGPDAGVLDRSAVRKSLLNRLVSDLNGRNVDRHCNVPIGVVATKVRPGEIAYDRHITVRNQRFVGLYEARALGDSVLRFVRARKELLDNRAIGSQLVLPADANLVISPDRVFSLAEASSSYPVAFAPVEIEYYDPTCVVQYPDPPGCQASRKEAFMDGGVFDNNPVSLAVDIYRTIDSLGKQRVLYVDPDATRDPLDADVSYRRTLDDAAVPAGVAALLRFGMGFVPASRNYELQSFIRAQAGLPPQKQAVILSSTRAHPLIGEHLGAFAAFLGRPFRELDFYIGVGDGMQFLAAELFCRTNKDPDVMLRSNDPGQVSVAQRTKVPCVARVTDSLSREAFALSPVGRYIVRKALQREYSGMVVPMPAPAESGERARLTVLESLEAATFAKLEDRRPYECAGLSLVGKALCIDGFDRVLGHLKSDTVFLAILRCTEDDSKCGRGEGALPRYPEPLEKTLPLVENGEETIDEIITRALQQMRATEKTIPGGGFAGPVKLLDLGWRSYDGSNRPRDMGPSSIPRNDDLRWKSFRALPYYAGLSLDAEGRQVGWQPSWHGIWKGLGLFAPVEAYWQPRKFDTRERVAAAVSLTPSIGVDFSSSVVNQLTVGGRFTTDGKVGEGFIVRAPFFEVSAYGLVRKVRFGGYLVPARYTGRGKDRWVVTASIADVNGALYWMLR